MQIISDELITSKENSNPAKEKKKRIQTQIMYGIRYEFTGDLSDFVSKRH